MFPFLSCLLLLVYPQLLEELPQTTSLPSYISFSLGWFLVTASCTKDFPGSSVGKESTCSAGDPIQFLGQEDPLEKGLAIHSSILLFSCGSVGKEFACNAGDLGSVPELGRPPREGKGYALQYSSLDNSMDCIIRLQRARHG